MSETLASERVSAQTNEKTSRRRLQQRYLRLRRNMIIIMLLVTIIPLSLMLLINAFQYQSKIKSERIEPMRAIVNKSTHSFELFLEERVSAIRFLGSSYKFSQLSDPQTLNQVYHDLRDTFGGYVDLGLINNQGIQVAYAGPYDLLGKSYSEQQWFQEVQLRGTYISDVFMGYRKFPHIALAAQHLKPDGTFWVLRATMDTKKFDNLIAAMGLSPISDAFIINKEGVLQTESQFYGDVLEKCRLSVPRAGAGTHVTEKTDPNGREVFQISSNFLKHDYTLVTVIPREIILKSWHSLRQEMIFIFILSFVAILLVIFWVTNQLVKRIQDADERREAAFRNLEYTQKLSSIGRLAAGVAHEINNPLSIINEKAGLLKDLVEHDRYQDKDKLLKMTASINQSVNRCKSITQRLLGFARQIGVHYEMLDVNEVLKETVGFLKKEAISKNLQTRYELNEEIPKISSDRGQIQQVFLNIINNAFAAVEPGGKVTLKTWEVDTDTVAASISDNGTGMTDETIKQIFEPFFTTKKQYGTGLGLSITYGIVKKLGGDIKVQSELGEGSTFTIYLPKKQAGEQNE
ncbi:MAG TPA: ATP-binding protein [Desulfosalsimonadaceae bacterium]|nr:ATP-binding protein [Desulfosalsimonadaceae bacterium]